MSKMSSKNVYDEIIILELRFSNFQIFFHLFRINQNIDEHFSYALVICINKIQRAKAVIFERIMEDRQQSFCIKKMLK